MTEKELLYVEDALNHIIELRAKFTDFNKNVQDEQVQTFINGLCKREEQMFQQFYSLL